MPCQAAHRGGRWCAAHQTPGSRPAASAAARLRAPTRSLQPWQGPGRQWPQVPRRREAGGSHAVPTRPQRMGRWHSQGLLFLPLPTEGAASAADGTAGACTCPAQSARQAEGWPRFCPARPSAVWRQDPCGAGSAQRSRVGGRRGSKAGRGAPAGAGRSQWVSTRFMLSSRRVASSRGRW